LRRAALCGRGRADAEGARSGVATFHIHDLRIGIEDENRRMTKNNDFTELEAPQANERKNLRVGSLPKETIKALEESRRDERHAPLNKLMHDPPLIQPMAHII
jgi:hypothetical protein